jgi:hypothetical protein
MITQRVELITPEMAKNYLEKNLSNRPIRPYHVQMFIQRLEARDFSLTHQGIALAEDGSLLDGQHRLSAIVQSGISAEMTVTEGLSAKSFQDMDCGIPRRLSDRIIIDDQDQKRNNRMVSTCQAIVLISSSVKSQNMNKVPSSESVWRAYNLYQASLEAIVDEVFYKIAKEQRPLFFGNRNILAALTLYHHYSPEEGVQFAAGLISGAGLVDPADPVLVCRNFLQAHKGKRTPKKTLFRIYWAINRFHARDKVKNCAMNAIPFFLGTEKKKVVAEVAAA